MKIGILLKNKSVLINLAATGMLLFLHIRLFEYSFDDAYIHFRIARNLYETGEPYYNLHEAIQVSSSPSWTVLLTIIYAILSKLNIVQLLPQAVAVFNAGITLLGANVAHQLILQIPSSNQQRAALLSYIAYILGIIPASMGLMETPTAVLLAMTGLLMLTKADRRGFILLSGAVFFRLELLVVWGLSYLFCIRRNGFRVSDLGYMALGASPSILYELYYFRTLLPHTLIAKSRIYSINTVESLSEIVTSPLRYSQLDWLGSSKFLQSAIVPFVIFLVFIVAINLVPKLYEKDDWWTVLSLWGLGIPLGYTVGRAFVFDWYLPQYVIPISLAVIILLFRNDTKYNIYLVSISTLLLILQLTGFVQTLTGALFYNPALYPGFENGARVRQYIEIGNRLQEEYPDASLLAAEIGALGYAFHGYIHDAAGLASPAALPYHPMKIPDERMNGWIAAIPPGYVKSTDPEIIVSYDIFAQALRKSAIEENYVIIAIPAFRNDDAQYTEKTVIFESEYVRIYLRKDQPIKTEILELGTH